jgi:arabinofuranosyltransferase
MGAVALREVEEVAPPPIRSPWRRVLQLAVLAAPVLVLALLVWKYRTIYDDGFIYLRVVQQLMAGHGLVFNQGQRVEAFTSPLWLFILSFSDLVTPFPLEWIAVVLGIAFTLAGVTLSIVASMRLVRRESPGAFVLPLGTLILMAVFPLWTLSTTGLETGMIFGWLGACLFVLVRWSASERDVPWWGAVVLGLGPLVRPELLLDTLVFMAMLLYSQRLTHTWRARVRLVAFMAALPVLYQLFRMGYYGQLVANTAIAKQAASPRPGLGLRYLWNFVEPYWLLLPLVAVAVGAYLPLAAGLRRAARRGVTPQRSFSALVAFPLAGLLNVAFVTLMGGDYVHGRLLLPGLFAVCAPVSVVPVARKYVISMVVVPWALVSALALRPPLAYPTVSPFWLRTQPRGVTVAQWGWGANSPARRWYTGPGLYWQNTTFEVPVKIDDPPASDVQEPLVALSAIGLISYAFGPDFNALDQYGLATPIDAHFSVPHRGLTGHEKPMPTDWLIALMTAPGSSEQQFDQLQQSPYNERLTNPNFAPVYTGHQLAVETAWARAALRCPAIQGLEQSASAPMSVGRFFSNLVHSVGRTELKIPPDPEQAYHQFCGPGTPSGVRRLQS